MQHAPTDLTRALETFDRLWSPRIVTTVNDHDVRVAKVEGEHLWHAHDDTDEFFCVLDGELHIALRDGDGERTVVLTRGSVFVVPRGVEHKPSSEHGASLMLFERSGTSSVGTRHEAVPEHVDATTGRALT
ncbi:cupin domain-containing protein [Saccharomonospora cyanea]|uniref:Cupin domain-containing protein n=1 Tax=Saccharomonospora cyanea NA-134 TaxID=882082 RepID=H5XRB5_9PSEU|nr:cupin domain-containing protein [Saccharomonospora cyanea]EHR63396.1 cupin domain-containing protein [Saccharomonospora cyanea NA-134]